MKRMADKTAWAEERMCEWGSGDTKQAAVNTKKNYIDVSRSLKKIKINKKNEMELLSSTRLFRAAVRTAFVVVAAIIVVTAAAVYVCFDVSALHFVAHCCLRWQHIANSYDISHWIFYISRHLHNPRSTEATKFYCCTHKHINRHQFYLIYFFAIVLFSSEQNCSIEQW